MMIKKMFVIVIFLTFLNNINADIPSDTNPPVRYNNQVTLNGDRVQGFASIAGGFLIQSSGIWDSFFGVEGPLDFGSTTNTLTLFQDLIQHDVSSVARLGNIIAEGHAWDVASTVTCLSSGLPTPPSGDCTVELVYEEDTTNYVISTLDWSLTDTRFIADGFTSMSSGDPVIRVYNWNGATLTQVATAPFDTTATTNTLRWNPVRSLIAIARDAVSTGPEVRVYAFNTTTFALTLQSSIEYGIIADSVAWHPSGNFLAVAHRSIGGGPQVEVYAVDPNGIINPVALTSATIPNGAHVCPHAFEWDFSGQFLAVGHDKDPSLLVYEFNGAVFTNPTTPDSYDFINNKVQAIRWRKGHTNGDMAVGLGSGDTKLRLHVMNYDYSTGVITKLASTDDSSRFPESVEWDPSGTCLATALTNGTSEFQIFTYDDVAGTLMLTYDEARSESQTHEIRWRSDGEFLAKNGTLEGDKSSPDKLQIYSSQPINGGGGGGGSGTDNCAIFSDIHMYLKCNMCLDNVCITFTGQSSINGRGKILSLINGSQINVGANSVLLLKDIIIQGLQANNIAVDQTSTLSLSDVQWEQSSDFAFNTGTLDIIKDFLIKGENKQFIYRSTQTSTIEPYARLILDDDVIFRYEPSNGDQNLLQMINQYSQLLLLGSKLSVASTGIQLTKGTIFIDRKSTLNSEALIAAGGISFGDGISPTNNVTLRVLPAAVFEAQTGFVNYKNV